MSVKLSSAPVTMARATTSVLLDAKQHLTRNQKNMRID
jgi:hypothetical protein